jgi:Xaa-Pro aminopeptidase
MAIIKTKSEIKKVEKACKITDAIFLSVLKVLKHKLKNCTEVELRDFILAEIKSRKLLPSFPPIVTSGSRAGNEIHPQPTNSKLKGFVIIDFGVIYEKYMSDMTRTIYIGSPSKGEKEIYSKLLLTQKECVKLSRIGTPAGLIDAQARALLGEHRKYFIHTLGHGVGTKIHEEPKIFYKITKPILKENMVITIEPGLYVKGKFGMRIEDTVLIVKGAPKALTKSSKELISIKW